MPYRKKSWDEKDIELSKSEKEWWLERAKEFEKFVRDAHWVDIVIQKDGKEIRQEGDWIKHLIRWFNLLNEK